MAGLTGRKWAAKRDLRTLLWTFKQRSRCVTSQKRLRRTPLVSGWNSTNPAVSLVPRVGGSFSSGPPQRAESVESVGRWNELVRAKRCDAVDWGPLKRGDSSYLHSNFDEIARNSLQFYVNRQLFGCIFVLRQSEKVSFSGMKTGP